MIGILSRLMLSVNLALILSKSPLTDICPQSSLIVIPSTYYIFIDFILCYYYYYYHISYVVYLSCYLCNILA